MNKGVFIQRACFLEKAARVIVVYSEKPNQSLCGVEVRLEENRTFSLHYCYVKITIFHPRVSKIKLRFYLKPGNREPMFECWDESGSEHPDMVPHRGIVDIDIFQMSIYRTSICHIDQG